MILSAMIKALSGRKRWLKVKRRYKVDREGVYVVMMPDADREFNECALRRIDDFLNYRKGNSAVILTTDEWTANNARRFSEHVIAVEWISERDYKHYFDYFYYQGFSERFIMMSLRGWHGERLALAETVNGITKEDMACLGLFIIRNWAIIGAANG